MKDFLSLVCTLVMTSQVFSQNRIDTVDQTRVPSPTPPTIENFDTQKSAVAPETYPGEAADTGVQFLVRVKPREQYVEASVDSQYYYTSNVYLQANDPKGAPVDTCVFVNTVNVAYTPICPDLWGGKLFPRIGFTMQSFNYGLDKTENQLNNLDFVNETVSAGAKLQIWQNWVFGLGFDWTRLLSEENQSGFNEFYKEYVPGLNVTRYFQCTDNLLFSLGYDARWRITDTDPLSLTNPGFVGGRQTNDRIDNGIFVALAYLPVSHLTYQPYYRFVDSKYTQPPYSGRNDILHTFGASLTYDITTSSSVRCFASYDIRNSNDPTVANYRNLNGGVGCSLDFKF